MAKWKARFIRDRSAAVAAPSRCARSRAACFSLMVSSPAGVIRSTAITVASRSAAARSRYRSRAVSGGHLPYGGALVWGIAQNPVGSE